MITQIILTADKINVPALQRALLTYDRLIKEGQVVPSAIIPVAYIRALYKEEVKQIESPQFLYPA